MARKKLLSEGEGRQFMKLANLGALSETYFTNNPLEERDEEEELEAELHATEDELGDEDHVADEEGDELDALEDEVPVEDDLGGGDSEGLVMSLLQAVQDWAEEHGVDMDLEGDEGGEEVEAAALDIEEPVDELPGEEEVAFAAEEEEEIPGNMGDLYEEESETTETTATLSEDEIVAEVARRVAARLKADEQKEKMAEQLAERIFSRLTSK